ncbi:hypothetical protein B0T16DRAFT_235115 [Cercophora newfieldiana]|uniref:Uncharacterized protein n=1 Tax=Cercophora newfieldiana TaxID=92897 RepID=A0AA39XRM4_9PEZI|nr:hypothetical protein B0T16DRAFT_235115 [Cercophora newfieldiana]
MRWAARARSPSTAVITSDSRFPFWPLQSLSLSDSDSSSLFFAVSHSLSLVSVSWPSNGVVSGSNPPRADIAFRRELGRLDDLAGSRFMNRDTWFAGVEGRSSRRGELWLSCQQTNSETIRRLRLTPRPIYFHSAPCRLRSKMQTLYRPSRLPSCWWTRHNNLSSLYLDWATAKPRTLTPHCSCSSQHSHRRKRVLRHGGGRTVGLAIAVVRRFRPRG